MILIYDTETTGFKKPLDRPLSEQPYLVQLGMMLCDLDGNELKRFECMIKPDGWTIPPHVSEIHGITTEEATEKGIPLDEALIVFEQYCRQANTFVAHNIDFDHDIMLHALMRMNRVGENYAVHGPEAGAQHCTMKAGTPICQLPKSRGTGFKFPKLIELHLHFFGEGFEDQHSAMGDVLATKRIYFELVKAGAFDA